MNFPAPAFLTVAADAEKKLSVGRPADRQTRSLPSTATPPPLRTASDRRPQKPLSSAAQGGGVERGAEGETGGRGRRRARSSVARGTPRRRRGATVVCGGFARRSRRASPTGACGPEGRRGRSGRAPCCIRGRRTSRAKMLSVQSPGYAGMGQRLGTPGGPGGGGGADRHHQYRDLNDLSHLPNIVSLQQMSQDYSRFMELQARTLQPNHSEVLNFPHRIALPDGEQGQDRHLKLRVDYQQAELTRSAVQPPPNKSVQDVPDWTPPQPASRKPPSPNKKDGFVQKAVKYLVSKASFSGGKGAESATPNAGTVSTGAETGAAAGAGGGGGTGGAEANRRAPCVMVPLRPPPAPAPPPPAPPAPPSPPHASPS